MRIDFNSDSNKEEDESSTSIKSQKIEYRINKNKKSIMKMTINFENTIADGFQKIE